MTTNTSKKSAPSQPRCVEQAEATSATTLAGRRVATSPHATAIRSISTSATNSGETASAVEAQLHGDRPRNRKASSAEPLAKFRAKGVTPWDKATRYELAAIRALSQFGLLTVKQLGEWVFKSLATPAARHRQAQVLTLRLCPAAQAHSRSQRLATAGQRPVLRALGRKRIGSQYYYLNAAGLRFVRDKHDLVLPDATKLLTTAVDMAKRELAFEYALVFHRTDAAVHFVGRGALAAHAARHHEQDSLSQLLLRCLSNLWGSFNTSRKASYVFVADRPGTSNGANHAYYRELATVASLQLERTIRIVVIGRRSDTEVDCALTETRLAKSVAQSKSKANFWSRDGRTYEAKQLTNFFASLKPHEESIRALMERHRA